MLQQLEIYLDKNGYDYVYEKGTLVIKIGLYDSMSVTMSGFIRFPESLVKEGKTLALVEQVIAYVKNLK